MKTKRYLKSFVTYAVATMMLVATSCKEEEVKPDITSFTLSENVISLVKGTSQTLTVKVDPSGKATNVNWSSANEKIAIVEEGKITAVGVGKTSVSAKIGNNTAVCDVMVTPAFVSVQALTLNKTAADIPAGSVEFLTFTFTPEDVTNRNITWSSDNDAIATVDQEGTVTGIAPGTAVITVTSEDGGKTATFTANVMAIPVSGITLDKAIVEMSPTGEEKLTAIVNPFNASNKDLIWTTSNADVATVDNGTVKAVSIGTATITAMSVADNTIKVTCEVTVKQKYISPNLIFDNVFAGTSTITGVQNLELSNNGTQFKGTITSAGVNTFNWLLPQGTDVPPPNATILKFEYKVDRRINKDWFQVYVVYKNSAGILSIAEGPSVKNKTNMQATTEWITYEMDLTNAVAAIPTEKVFNAPHIFSVRANSYGDPTPSIPWEFRNVRLETK